MSNGFVIWRLEHKYILKVAMQDFTQTRERIQIHMPSQARIQPINEIFCNPCFFRQFARGHTLACGNLIFTQQNRDAPQCSNIRTHVLILRINDGFVK